MVGDSFRRMSKGLYWTFTLNNYTAEEEGSMMDALAEQCIYLIVGKEVGEEGTPHLQGYLGLKNSMLE